MCALDRGGVHVARIDPDPTACGDRLGNGPVERIVEHAVWIDDPTPKEVIYTAYFALSTRLMTGAASPCCIASMAVQRPSPESAT